MRYISTRCQIETLDFIYISLNKKQNISSKMCVYEQVTILVLDADGQPLEDCLFGAAGMEGSSEYQSLVIYHHNSPSWAETVRLAIPIDKFYGSHVRFEFRHCSSKSLQLL